MTYVEESARKRVIPSVGRSQWRWPMSWGLKDEWDFFPQIAGKAFQEEEEHFGKTSKGLEVGKSMAQFSTSLYGYTYRPISSMVQREARSLTSAADVGRRFSFHSGSSGFDGTAPWKP